MSALTGRAVREGRRCDEYRMAVPPQRRRLGILPSNRCAGQRTWDSGPMGTETAALQLHKLFHPVTIALRYWLKPVDARRA